jgi:hypothetical protein
MGNPATGFLHITRVQDHIDPVKAAHRLVFAPLGGRLRRRHPYCQGLDALTDFLRQAGVPMPEIERALAGSREATGSLHPGHHPDTSPDRGARALAPSANAKGDEAVGVYSELRGFILAHRGCAAVSVLRLQVARSNQIGTFVSALRYGLPA